MPTIETLRWVGDHCGRLVLIDQTRLPVELVELECRTVESLWRAIKELRVRGAPAIGIAAAYGVVLGQSSVVSGSDETFVERLNEVTAYLASSRPTAVNLFWALDRMKIKGELLATSMPTEQKLAALLTEAKAIHE